MKLGKRHLAVVALLGIAALPLVPEAPPGPTGAWLRAAGLTPRFETVDGLRVRYLRTGSGPSLVLLHGFASSIYSWKDVIGPLSAHHDVVALDLPGFGASDQPADLAAQRLPGVVLGLLDRLGITRASVAGNSLGGAVAVFVAAAAPERVDRLVLIDAAGYNFASADRPFVLRLVASPVGLALGYLPVRRMLTRAAMGQVFFDAGKVTPERVEEYYAPISRPGALEAARSLLATRWDAFRDFDRQVRAVRAPTLVLWGREDAWIPLAHADRFVAAIPGARKEVIEACGHVPQEEKPQEVLARLLAFLAEGKGDGR